MTIWQFQSKVTKRLLRWSLFSMVTGVFMLRGNAYWRGVGWQFIGWGAVDALIALFGGAAMDERLDRYVNPGAVDVKAKEAENFEKILWVNAALDVAYIVAGKRWGNAQDADDMRKGTGTGVVLQGLFLLIFDTLHALSVPKEK